MIARTVTQMVTVIICRNNINQIRQHAKTMPRILNPNLKSITLFKLRKKLNLKMVKSLGSKQSLTKILVTKDI